MKKWDQRKLRDLVVKIGSGVTPKGGSESYSTSGVPLIRSQNVQLLGFSEKGLAYIDLDTDRRMAGSRVIQGDVLLNITGASIGRVCVVPDQYCPANVNQHVCIIRCGDKIVASFLASYLGSPNIQKFICDSQAGATRQALTMSQIGDFAIPVPEPNTQHRIAAELDSQLSAIDEARVAAERRVAAAEALEAALFRELFHGLSPVMIGLPKDAAPAGWKWTRLLGLVDLESGHTPSRRHPEWWDGDIPWIALPDIRALDGKVAMETKERTNPLGIANSSTRILPKDTVALSRTASVGFVTIFGRPMATSQDFVNWICGPDLSPRFLMHALRGCREHFLANASGAIHKTLYMPAVKDFHLCHPPRKQQDSLAAALDLRLADATTLLTAARAELAAIQALPAAALRKVFGGETVS